MRGYFAVSRPLKPDACPDRGAFAVRRGTVRAHAERAYGGGQDEGLRIVHYQGLESAIRALDERLLAFHQVQNVDTPCAVMVHSAREPVPPGLDEFEFMEASALLPPAGTLGEGNDTIDEVFA